jgi:hypothetical protein
MNKMGMNIPWLMKVLEHFLVVYLWRFRVFQITRVPVPG